MKNNDDRSSVKISNKHQPLDPDCASFRCFAVRGRKIRATSECDIRQVTGLIPFAVQDHFSIKLTRISHGEIGLGAIDSKHKHNMTTNYFNHKNIIFYSGANGFVFGDQKGFIKGKG